MTLREGNTGEIISKAALFWSVGGFVFGLAELWTGIGIYPWVFQSLSKLWIGPFVYSLIGMILGGALGCLISLFAKSLQMNWLQNIELEPFYIVAEISFFALIVVTFWLTTTIGIVWGRTIQNYLFIAGLIFVFYICGCILYKVIVKKKTKENWIPFFVALSCCLYVFLSLGLYLNFFVLPGFFTPKSMIYNLLSLSGSVILGLCIYYLLLKVARFNWLHRIGMVFVLIGIITITTGIIRVHLIEASGKGKTKSSKALPITMKKEVQRSQKPNVLLLSIDTLRADYLSCYGNNEIKTPSIDSLADNGVLFDRSIAQSSWTVPSLSSMLTSLYPATHGLIKKASTKDSLPKAQKDSLGVRLAEVLNYVGYKTQAIVMNPFILPAFHFDKGFDNFCLIADVISEKKEAFLWKYLKSKIFVGVKNSRSKCNHTVEITKKAIEWLKSKRAQPFFLWIHYLDPHMPYERYKTYGLNPGYKGILRDTEFVRRLIPSTIRLDKCKFSVADKNQIKTFYKEEILFVDENVGLLLKKLEELKLVENTIIVLTSDHGEEFWDHNGFEHGHTMYQELVHVPLIFQFPGVLPRRKRISKQVRIIDIMPTILDLAGIEHNLKIQGKSLMPIIKGEEKEDRIAFSDNLLQYEERKLIRTKKYSFIYFPDSQKKELYDLEKDSLEMNNVADEYPELCKKFRSKIISWQEDCKKLAETLGKKQRSSSSPLPKKAKERLKSLGYL